jgi:hypothetical protein
VSAVATRQRFAFVSGSPATQRPAPRLLRPARSGEVSLEDSILGVWEDLTETGRAGCPVCGAGAAMRAGRGCDSCGSSLS